MINSLPVKSLLLTLESPTELFISSRELPDKPLLVSGLVTTRPSFPPWPTCADILFNSKSRIFVGLSYPVGSADEGLARSVCSRVSSEIMRYNAFTVASLRKPYEANADFEIDRLEIVWMDAPADSFETAQLDSGFWFYSLKHFQESRVVAFGLTHIDEILHDYQLTLPDVFHFPSFVPEFIEEQR